MMLSPAEKAVVVQALQRLAVDVSRGDTFGDEAMIRALRDQFRSPEPCEHPGLLPSLDAPHPRREPIAYEAWLNRTKRCHTCGRDIPEAHL
jgi:hypothetical protein